MEIFKILGRKIEIEDNLENYAKIRIAYRKIGEAMCTAFDEFWDKYCGSIHEVVELAPCFFENTISFLVKGAVEGLISNEIYDVDEDTFYYMHKEEFFDCSFMDSIVDKYEAIMRTKNQSFAAARSEYEYNSVSSSRWSGGGFGLTGAVKGAITASALNFIGDAVAERRASKTYNRQIEELDSIFENKLRELYNSGICDFLREKTWELSINTMYAFFEELEDNDLFEFPDLDHEKAGIIYKNTMKRGNSDILAKNLIDCIKLWPFEAEYYIALYKLEELSDEDRNAIENLAELMKVDERFLEETSEIRLKRYLESTEQHMKEYKKKSIIERADFVEECFYMGLYGSGVFGEDYGERIISFVNDEARFITEEINKYDGTKIDKKIENFLKENDFSSDVSNTLLIVVKCAEISKKYPFFETFQDEDYNLELNDSFLDFLTEIKTFYELLDENPANKMPNKLLNIIQLRLLTHWSLDAYDEEVIDNFDKIQKKFVALFDVERMVDSKTIKDRKKNLAKYIEIEAQLKSKYEEVLNEEKITVDIFCDLLNDIKTLVPVDMISNLANDYAKHAGEILTRDLDSLPIIDLYKLQKALVSSEKTYLSDRGTGVRKYFLDKIDQNGNVEKNRLWDSTYTIEFAEVLDVGKITQKSSAIYAKSCSLAKSKKVKEFFKLDVTNNQEWIEAFAKVCDININPNDVFAMHIDKLEDVDILHISEPGDTVGYSGFMITRDGLVNVIDNGTIEIVKYSEIKDIGHIRGYLRVLERDEDTLIMLGDVGNVKLADEIIDYMFNIFVYMFDLKPVNFDDAKFEKSINEVSDLLKKCESADVKELSNIIEKLGTYPDCISSEVIQKANIIFEEKTVELKNELAEITSNYQEKTEKEVKDIIARIKEMPKELIKDIKPEIEAFYKKLVSTREVETLVNNIDDCNVDEINEIIKKLNKYPLEISGDAIQKAKELLDEKNREIKAEFESVIEGYQNKTEKEVKDILSKIDKYPENLSKEIKPEIEARYNFLVDSRKVSELIKDIDKYSIEELEITINKLKKYPNEVSETAVEYVQGKIEEKNRAIKAEYEALVDDYQNKSEDEIKVILEKLDKYPEYLSEGIKTEIEARYNFLVDSRKVSELVKNINGYSIEELEITIIKLKKYPREVSEAAVEYVQGKIEEKNRAIKAEYEALVDGYQNKTENELKEILLKMDDYPQVLTKEKRPLIESKYNALVKERIKREEEERIRKEAEALNAEFVSDMAMLSTMSKAELENAISKWCNRKSIKPEAGELIDLAMSLMLRAHEKDIKSWMPNEYTELSEVEVTRLIKKYESEKYDKSFDDKYFVPLVALKNSFLLDRIELFINFVKTKTEFLGSRVIVATKLAASNQLNSLGKEGDIFVARMMLGMELCNIYTNKITFGGNVLRWNEIQKIEFEKKLFKSSIKCRCKSGQSLEMKLTNDTNEMMTIANVLSSIHEYMIKIGVIYATTGSTGPKKIFLLTPVEIIPESVPEPVPDPVPTPVQSDPAPATVQPVPAPVPVQSETTNAGFKVVRNYSEMCAFINKSSSGYIGGKIISNLNPKFSKKLANAIKAYAINVKANDVFALYDDTLFGSGKEGFVMTLNGITVKPGFMNACYCDYADIKSIKVVYDAKSKITRVLLATQNGDIQLTGCLGEESINFAQHLNVIFKELFGLDAEPFTVEKQ